MTFIYSGSDIGSVTERNLVDLTAKLLDDEIHRRYGPPNFEWRGNISNIRYICHTCVVKWAGPTDKCWYCGEPGRPGFGRL